MREESKKFFRSKEEISLYIEEYLIPFLDWSVKKKGFRGVVLELKGDLDSSVVAALAVRTFGNYWVKGVYMPCQNDMYTPYSQDQQNKKENVEALAEWLDIDIINDDLTTPFTVLLHRINVAIGTRTGMPGEISDSAKENLKSRLKMSTLYCVKDNLDLLTFGSINKTHKNLGLFTDRADDAMDLSFLDGFFETEVFIMADILGINKNVPIIINRSQKDFNIPEFGDCVKISYEDIDIRLTDLILGGKREKDKLDKILISRIENKKI